MIQLVESDAWEAISVGILLLILGSFFHFWMTRFGRTKWMKAVGALLTLCLYWILFGLGHPTILIIVAIGIGASVFLTGRSTPD